jgi:RNA polymerase sigma factor (sigma-70 family)
LDSELLPDAVLEREETRELVDVAMSNLPSQYREVLQAKYVDNLSLEHIAGLRDTTIDSVKSMLRRARAAFRECFLAIAKVEMSDV